MTSHRIRVATPADLEHVIAIDDAASCLYLQAGLSFELDETHPFVIAEVARWADAIEKDLAYIACNESDQPVGFAALGIVDTWPYLDQLSVHPDFMRLGIGTRLLQSAIAWSGDRPLCLTTYAHLAWNKPYYERLGFEEVAERDCGPELQDILQSQREALPDPEQRIAMIRQPAS